MEVELILSSYKVTRPDSQPKPLAVMLWGIAGCGKTTLAATAPGRKLWLNFDPRGTTSLIGRDDVLVLDLADERPSVVDKFKDENPLGLAKFITDNEIDTLVFDSTTNFADLCLRHAIPQVKGATIERPSKAAYGGRNAVMLAAVKNLLRLCGRLNKHIVFIAHEDVPEKTEEGTVLYISIMLGGKLQAQMPLDLSECWAMYETNGKRTIAIRPCRQRKPMKTRMFVTSGEPEFTWKYNADTGKGDGIAEWYEQWLTAGKKIPLPK